MTFWRWLFPLSSSSLMRENRLLRLRLEAKQHECDLLAEINENLRRWVIANTAAAVHVARMHGVGDEPQEQPMAPRQVPSASPNGEGWNGRLSTL